MEDLARYFTSTCLDMRRLLAGVETPVITGTNASTSVRKSITRTQERDFLHGQAIADDQNERNVTTMARIFPFLMDTLHKLTHKPEGTKFSGQLIYHVVALLRDLLNRLCLLCATEGREKHGTVLRTESTKGRAVKQIATYLAAPNASSEAERGNKMIKLLYQLSIVMMDALDQSRVADCDILEGFMFFLLTRVGTLLQDFVFREDEKENQKPIQGFAKSEAAAIREIQAPFVLGLLKHAVMLTAERPMPEIFVHRRSGRTPPVHLQGFHRSHNSISAKTRTRLQNTLLRGVFGEDAASIGESLRRPLDLNINLPHEADMNGRLDDVDSWFKKEVWELVGWDVLREAIAWK